MSAPTHADARLLTAWTKDLSVCTEAELRERWSGTPAEAIDRLDFSGFEGRLAHHNPIYFLAERCWFDNQPDLLHAPLHRDKLCAALLEHYLDDSREFTGLVVLIQRDSFKSTFSHGVFPMWVALREHHLYHRDARIALVHHRENQASDNLQRLKRKVARHPWLQQHWPEFCPADERDFGTKLAFDWPCKTTSAFAEPSVMAAGLGARLTGYHFDLVVFDDIVTEEHIDSKVVRDEAFGKYQASRFLRDTFRGKEVCTGTPYHPNDLWSKLLKANADNVPLYRSVCLSAYGSIAPYPSFAYVDDKTLSFPRRHSFNYLDKLRQEYISRSGNDDLFQLQMLCCYRSTRMIAAQWEWMKHCKQEEVPPTTYRCIFVDPAWKGTENSGEGDSACVAVLAFEKRGSIMFRYILDGTVSNTMTDAEGRALVFQYMHKYGVVDVAPEERGGKAFKQSLRNEAQTRGKWINVLDLKSQQTNKSQRITTLLGECQTGRVWLCDEADFDFREQFKDQFENFPQVDHDDVLDCIAYSCDSNVTERVVPQWNDSTKPWWIKQHEEENYAWRTRYCAN